MITIEVVRLASGIYVGRTFSDRWNMKTLRDLGIEDGLKLDINKCANKGQVDRLRRTLKGLGFALRVSSKGGMTLAMRPEESHAMSGAARPARRTETGRRAA